MQAGVPADFPPTPVYELRPLRPEASPSFTIPFSREVTQEKWLTGPDGRLPWADPAPAYRTWLAAAGGVATRRACERPHEATIADSSRGTLQWLVRGDEQVIRRDFAAMVQELVQGHRVVPEQVQAVRANVRVHLIDYRGDRTQPLPDADGLLLPWH